MSIPIHALSIKQPWAWAIIHAGKDVENRGSLGLCKRGATIGEFAVHASKGMTRYEYEQAKHFMSTIGIACPDPDELIRGAIIGHVSVWGFGRGSNRRWFMGPYRMDLEHPKACEPIATQGQLGFFKWSPKGQIDAPKPWMKSYSAIRGEEE